MGGAGVGYKKRHALQNTPPSGVTVNPSLRGNPPLGGIFYSLLTLDGRQLHIPFSNDTIMGGIGYALPAVNRLWLIFVRY
jgi:hypothetical protein